MSYKVWIVKDGSPRIDAAFDLINDAFAYLGKLDFTPEVEQCVLEDGTFTLFNLKRDEHGRLSSFKG